MSNVNYAVNQKDVIESTEFRVIHTANLSPGIAL